jgi:hypothetical protein
MLRYKLRTLLIVLALGPPLLAVAWWVQIELNRLRRDWQYERQGRMIKPVGSGMRFDRPPYNGPATATEEPNQE